MFHSVRAAVHRDYYRVERGVVQDQREPVEPAHSIYSIQQPFPQRIQHILLGGRVDPLVAECLLCLATIALGELRAHEAPEFVRLDSLNVFR